MGGEVLVGLPSLPLEYAYEDCLRYSVSALNTSSQEEPDEFIHPGV